MPLVLSLRTGQDFYVGDEQLIVQTVRGSTCFDVRVASTGKVHEITNSQAAEVLDDVFVSAGDRPQPGLARVAIEAPSYLLILRGEKYRTGEAKVTKVQQGARW